MESESASNEENELEQIQYLQMIVEIRKKAFLQILFGLLWWMGSAIAMFFALSSTGGTFYWYGGALGSLFHWYRAFTMINATRKAGAKALVKNEGILIGITAALVIFSTSHIVPEYFRVDSPTIGTCWGAIDNEYYGSVACWSGKAVLKTVDYAYASESCPAVSTQYFDPSDSEVRYTCLVDN